MTVTVLLLESEMAGHTASICSGVQALLCVGLAISKLCFAPFL